MRTECICLYFYRRVKAWTKSHFLHEAPTRFIQNVLRSTLLHANKSTKKCIQFLNSVSSTHRHELDSNSQRWWLYALITHVVVNPTTIRSRPHLYLQTVLCILAYFVLLSESTSH